ncbi:hypothetical protein ACGTNG_12570 [Halomonas sp. 1390]|uniref:hypothetical protein n=1 Tax=Halomonas sp. B23F22_3 TaxID=3459516 RepID=UPI00373F1D7A
MTQQNDAIDPQAEPGTDVSADPNHQPAGDDTPSAPEPTEREQRLADIARQYREHHGYGDEPEPDQPAAADPEEEPEPGNDSEADADPEQDPGEQDAGREQDPNGDPAADEDPLESLGYYRKPDGKLYTTMKVNGQEREVPAEQVKAYLQKDIAGDYKLQQAAERERQLAAWEQTLREQESQRRQAASQQPPESGAEEARQKAKDVLAKFYDGDDDAAAEALVSFMTQHQGQQLSPDELLTQAEQRATQAIERREAAQRQEAWNQSVNDGVQWLQETHPDITPGSDLHHLIDLQTERFLAAQQNGDPEFANMAPRDIIERATTDTLRLAGRQDAGGKPAGSAREARKRSLKPVPRGQSRQPSQKVPQEPDTSPVAVIERMRQSRAVN